MYFFYFRYCVINFFLILVYSFYFLFHTVVVPTQFPVVAMSSLSILITILLSSLSDSLLAAISFSSFTGESSIPFYCRLFLCLSILDDSFCLFLWFWMLWFASCLHRVNFCGRKSVGFSGTLSFFSLSWCSRVPLSSICVGSLVVLGFYLLVAPLLVGYHLQQVYWYSQLPPYLVCDLGQDEGGVDNGSSRVLYGI